MLLADNYRVFVPGEPVYFWSIDICEIVLVRSIDFLKVYSPSREIQTQFFFHFNSIIIIKFKISLNALDSHCILYWKHLWIVMQALDVKGITMTKMDFTFAIHYYCDLLLTTATSFFVPYLSVFLPFSFSLLEGNFLIGHK